MLGVRRSVAAGVSGKARIANTVSSFPVAPSLIDMHRHFAARIQQQSAANVFDRGKSVISGSFVVCYIPT